MLISMTGYGFGEASSDSVRLQVDLKSVNHRYCDVVVKLPREYQSLEQRVVTLIRAHYHRGRVDVTVRRTELKARGGRGSINQALAARYMAELEELRGSLGLEEPVRLSTLLSLPGVVDASEDLPDPETDWPTLEQAVKAALQGSERMRRQEGENLTRDLRSRLETLRRLHGEMASLSRQVPQLVSERLLGKVKEVLARAGAGEVDQGRLLQEVAMLADRADVSEELTRFASHLDQLDGLLNAKEPVGRRVDFLLQELQREANTTGSKTALAEVAHCAVMIKTELEKIREQIQNIE